MISDPIQGWYLGIRPRTAGKCDGAYWNYIEISHC